MVGRTSVMCVAVALLSVSAGSAAWAACEETEIMFSDDFSKPDPSWTPVKGNVFRDSRYVINVDPNGSVMDWPAAFVFSGNYSVCTEFKLPVDPNGAAGSGIAFWVDPDKNRNGSHNYYMAVASPDGYYWVSRVFNGTRSTVVEAAETGLIKNGPNDTNEIAVTLWGREGVFIVNGKEVGRFKGQPPKASYAGLTAGAPLDRKYVLEFRKFRVVKTAAASQPQIPSGAPFASWNENGRSGRYLLQILQGNGPPTTDTTGVVASDTDCEPDAQGFSHCQNEIDLPNGTRMTAINTHQMQQYPCLEPGQKLQLSTVAPGWVVAVVSK